MGTFDIELDGQGYQLAKDAQGQLLSGASQQQTVDPFTRHLSLDEPYIRLPFRFDDGCGLARYDGSNRYESGDMVDTRSGKLLVGPKATKTAGPTHQELITAPDYLVAQEISSGASGDEGLAQLFTVPTGATQIRSVAILVKRDPDTDYASASDFSVGIRSDSSGTPGAVIQSNNGQSPRYDEEVVAPWPDRWRNGEWFWLECPLETGTATVTPGNDYWIYVTNDQAAPIYLAEDQAQSILGATRSAYNGTSWGAGNLNYPLIFKIGYRDLAGDNDSYVRCFALFRGSDHIERLYAGTNYRIIYYDEPTSTWKESKVPTRPVTQLVEFNNKLFAACGPDVDIWYTDGASATTTWAQVTGKQSQTFTIYDNMLWRADGAAVDGSEDGTTWTAGVVTVGDPGSPVTSIVSHGGSLFAVKPEGVFEITYPDTYPTSGDPVANLLMDFSTERTARPWVLDWHSGLYFGGLAGIYEFKAGVLRNVWTEKIDEGALQVGESGKPYARPRSWGPLYDTGPQAWTAIHGTTRGFICARANPHLESSDLLWYDGRNWHALMRPRHPGGYEVYGEYITAVFVEDIGGGRGRLWFNQGEEIHYLDWPTWTNDTSQDGAVDYNRQGWVFTPRFALDGQSKEIALVGVGVVCQNVDNVNNFVMLGYRADEASTYTTLSSGDTPTSPYFEKFFPSGTTCRSVQLQIIVWATSAGNGTPAVEQVDLLYQMLPKKTTTHQLIIQLGGALQTNQGGTDDRSAGEILDDLEDLLEAGNVTFRDLYGRSKTVRALAVSAQTHSQLDGVGPEGYEPQGYAVVSLLEIDT